MSKRSQMRKWATANQKGGCGKTTLLLHLSATALADGKVVSIIDLDPQASAQGWASRREKLDDGAEPVVVPGLPDNLEHMLGAAAEDGTDLVLVDTAPRLDKSMLYAAAEADLVIIPTRSSSVDRDALRGTLKYLQKMKALDKAVVVLNACNSDTEARAALEALIAEFGVVRLKAEVPDIVGLATAIDQGRGAIERSARKPATVINAVYRELVALDRKLAKANGSGGR